MFGIMAGDFPNLDSAVIAQWPKPNQFNPTSRSWLPVYSATLEVVSTFVVRIGLCNCHLQGIWNQY